MQEYKVGQQGESTMATGETKIIKIITGTIFHKSREFIFEITVQYNKLISLINKVQGIKSLLN